MRTTISFDSDVAQRIKQLLRDGNTSMRQLVNDSLRRAFAMERRGTPEKFSIKPFSSDFVPGVDPLHLNRLNDELASEEFKGKASVDEDQ